MDRITDKVIVTAVHDPFDPMCSRETRLMEPRKTVAEYVDIFFPNAIRDGYDLAISINGVVANTEEVLPLQVKEGLSLAFCLVPRGGGGGKNIARIVAMIALTVLAVYTGGATAGWLGLAEGSFGAGMVTGIVGGAIVVVGSMVINAILPYQTPSMESIGGSPTYGWDQGTNYLLEGAALSILYGKRRVTPPVIARHIETAAGENNQYLSVLMALCEGKIVSIDASAIRSNLRINKVALSKYDRIYAEMRIGANTPETGQALVQDFNATYTDTAVGIKLTDNVNWITRTTAGNAVETIGVNFSCPGGLGSANSDGGLNQVILRIQVEYKKQGDSVWIRWEDYNQYPITITTGRWSAGCWAFGEDAQPYWWELEAGTASGHYEGEPYVPTFPVDEYGPIFFWHWVESTGIVGVGSVLQDHLAFAAATTSALRKGWKMTVPEGTYDIRVRLEDAYQTSAGVMADCYWDFFTEAVPDDFIYPNTALLAIRALATNQLSGSFPTIDIEIDRGDITLPTFGSKPSSNPAWACVDLLTNDRYGGGISIGKIDTAAFQAWADFCAANSYTCNLYIDQMTSVRAALNMISQLGRGTVIQLGSKFTVIVDKVEGTPVQRFMFSVGNIGQDSFKEQWLSQDDRANAIEVEYYDADLNYERTALSLYASDFDTTSLETKQATIILYGCTSRAMAIKHGKFLLNCNRYLTLTAQWDCDIDALACFPGDIVEVQHDIPQWGVGGRVVSSTASSVTLDRPVTIVSGTYHVRVKHQDDDTFEEKTVTDGAGTYTTLNISGTWTKNPVQYALYSFGLINFVVKLFRVLRISRANDLRRRITAIEYYEPIYSDSATVPAPTPWPDQVFVSNLKAVEIYKEGSLAGVALSWTGYATPFRIFVKRADETTYRSIGEAYGNSFESWGYDTGVSYTFLVTPGSNPNAGDGATVVITIGGHANQPAIPTPVFDDARCTYTDKIQLEWLAIDSTLLGYFELRTDLNWGNATNRIYQGKATSYTMKPTGASYTFYLKSHDTFGNYSTGYDSITLSQTVPVPVFVSIDGSKYGRVRIEWEPISDESYDVVEVYRAATNNRPTPPTGLVGTIHSNVFVDTTVAVSTTYYYWLRTKSLFGTYSAWESGETSGHSVATAQINTSDLADNAISQIKLATTIVPPEVVTSLPSLPDAAYPEGKIVYLTTDGKLYRNDQAGAGAGAVSALNTAAYNTLSSTLTYAISAGSNRYLVVCVTQEAADLPTAPTVTYGGQSMTLLVSAQASTTTDQRVDMYGLKEAGIAAASTTTISVSGLVGDVHSIHARSYQAVNQTTPVPETDSDNTISTTPNPLLLTIAAGAGSAAVSVSGCGDISTATWGSELTERTDTTIVGSSSAAGSMADAMVAGATTIDANCTWSAQSRAAAAAIEIAPATAGTGWTAVIYVDDLDRLIAGADIAVNSIGVTNLYVASFENLIENPRWEAGSSVTWNTSAGDWVVVAGSGEQAYMIEAHLKVAYTHLYAAYIPVSAGETYLIRYRSRMDTDADAGAFINTYVLYYDKADAGVTQTGGTARTKHTTWTEWSEQFTVPATAVSMQVTWYYSSTITAGHVWIEDPYCRKCAGGSLIVDGAITADKILANCITAGQIAVGAIGADEIAARTIAVEHLVVGNFFNLVANGNFQATPANTVMGTGTIPAPVASWKSSSGTNTVRARSYSGVPSGCPAEKCVEMASGIIFASFFSGVKAYSDAGALEYSIQVVAGETYHVSASIAKDGSFNGTSTLYVYYHKTDGTYNNSAVISAVQPTGSWATVSGVWTAPADAIGVHVYAYAYSFTAGKMYWANIRMHRMSDTNLIVDGAITADKLTANHLNAVNTESGTFQQTYTAPGDNNTTPGAGMKITAGKIEAYGGDQTFGGTIMSSDGNYMCAIGKYLTATGLTKRYPLNNATNFTADGQSHYYLWVTSAWIEIMNLGLKTVGSDYYAIYITRTGNYNHGVHAEVEAAFGIDGIATGAAGVGVRGQADDATGAGVVGVSLNGYGGSFAGHGGKGPITLGHSNSASAPSHTAYIGTLWVTSAGILYINTDGGTTWAKVGAQ